MTEAGTGTEAKAVAWPRKVLVTGATSGIGRALAARLLAEGCSVVGIGRDLAKAGLAGERFRGVALDLADLDALPARLEQLAREEADVEALVLNAGRGTIGALEQHAYGTIRAAMDLNFTSHAFVARAFLPGLKRRGGGRLVFLGSEAGLRGSRGGALYCAAKFALRGFAQALREDCARSGVAVSLVNPGMVRTPFFDDLDIAPGPDAANALSAEEVADAIAWILRQRPEMVVDELDLTPLKRVVERGRQKPATEEA